MYNYFKPRRPLNDPCKVCGCRLSRVRFISSRWLSDFLDGRMPSWAWNLIPSRCRACGDDGKEKWVDPSRPQQ